MLLLAVYTARLPQSVTSEADVSGATPQPEQVGAETPLGPEGQETPRGPADDADVPGQLGDRGFVNQTPGEPEDITELEAEAAPVRAIRSLSQPTAADIEHHNACGHVPFRD